MVSPARPFPASRTVGAPVCISPRTEAQAPRIVYGDVDRAGEDPRGCVALPVDAAGPWGTTQSSALGPPRCVPPLRRADSNSSTSLDSRGRLVGSACSCAVGGDRRLRALGYRAAG